MPPLGGIFYFRPVRFKKCSLYELRLGSYYFGFVV